MRQDGHVMLLFGPSVDQQPTIRIVAAKVIFDRQAAIPILGGKSSFGSPPIRSFSAAKGHDP